MTMRVGLFGGCFNPVHRGHLAVARAAQAQLTLGRLIFVPSRIPPFKSSLELLPGSERLALLELALAQEPAMEVSGISFTIDTARAFRAALPAETELFFIVGSDCLDKLPHWKGIRELAELVRFAVVQRPGFHRAMPFAGMVTLECADDAVSSTLVRDRLGRGEPVDDLVGPAVAARLTQAQGLTA